MVPRYFGLDIHQEFAMVTAVDRHQQVIYPARKVLMPNLPTWAAQELTAQDAVALEVTTNAWYVVDVVEPYAGRVVVANPYKTRLIAEAHIKNDKVDALALARLLAADFICEVWVPQAEVRQWRLLAQHRATLQQQGTQLKNRLHSLCHRHNWHPPMNNLFTRAGRQWLQEQAWTPVEAVIVAQALAQLALLETQLKTVDAQIAQLVTQDPRVTRLLQITGLGVYAAFALLAVIGDIQRFSSARKLTGYIGLVPREHQSGQRGYFGHITKAGNALVRWLMVEVAQTAIRWDPHWKTVHARIAQRRGSAIATVAVARKLLVVVWHMLTETTTYQHLRPQTYVTKLQNWAYTIGRQHLPAASSKEFVQGRLQRVGLDELAAQLISQKGTGKLRVPASALDTL